jgi:hypothetical protein
MTLEAASLITLAARSPDPVRFLDFEFSGSACFTDFFRARAAAARDLPDNPDNVREQK